ncbi:MAG: hypothetical protein EOS65_02595 [Mesorhizobium sp.]|uniref:hypothetical protein n=1 Tax=Mesorhizobium sp. TaxID=1871066 RepID=UPI000FE6B425|nr:hypothetical protein [Mesorhizobium sp.]RWF44284.1 MAG: hypothetical protein EOS65_02595 [Mesorhizobium sp.]
MGEEYEHLVAALPSPEREEYASLVERLATAKPDEVADIAGNIFRLGYAQGHIDGYDLIRDME